MRLRFHEDAGEFADVAGPLYRRDPVRHTIELTLMRGGSVSAPTTPLLLSVWDGSDVVGAALQTPPYPLACSGLDPAWLPWLVGELTSAAVDLNGVRGPRDIATEFAGHWRAATGAAAETSGRDRLYRLAALRAPQRVPGWPGTPGPMTPSC